MSRPTAPRGDPGGGTSAPPIVARGMTEEELNQALLFNINSLPNAPPPASVGTAPSPASVGTAPFPASVGTAPFPASVGTAPPPLIYGSVGTAPLPRPRDPPLFPASVGTNPLPGTEEYRVLRINQRLDYLKQLSLTPRIDFEMRFMDTIDVGMLAFYSLHMARTILMGAERGEFTRDIAMGFQRKYDMFIDHLNTKVKGKEGIERYLTRLQVYTDSLHLMPGDFLLVDILMPLHKYYQDIYNKFYVRKPPAKGGRKSRKNRKTRSKKGRK